jgi:hypothetical protein
MFNCQILAQATFMYKFVLFTLLGLVLGSDPDPSTNKLKGAQA